MSESKVFESNITVNVKLFAVYQEVCGTSEMQMEFPAGSCVNSVCDRLIGQHPQLAQWRSITKFGINLQQVESSAVLQDSDEVVLIPPVSGG